MYILAYDDQKKLENASLELKQNLKNYLEPFRMVTDAVIIKDAYYINLGLNFDITVIPGLSNNQILTDCIIALTNYFNIDKWQINQPIILSELYTLLDTVSGVQTVKTITINNLSGEELGYSKYSYDINAATLNNVIYPSLDPSIFEVKYPDNDIQGRVVTF
jgi:hypothetical protein